MPAEHRRKNSPLARSCPREQHANVRSLCANGGADIASCMNVYEKR